MFASGNDLDLIVAEATPNPTDIAMDLACGAGHVGLALAPHVARVVGADITPPLLAEARELASQRGCHNLSLVACSADAVPLPTAHFDIITCRYAAHHFADLPAVLAEAHRLLTPAGRLLVVDVVGPHDPAVATLVEHMEILRDASHVHDHSLGEWTAHLERSRFELRTIRTWRLPLEVDQWLRRMQTPPAESARVRALLADAPEAARAFLHIRTAPSLAFEFPVALFVATPA